MVKRLRRLHGSLPSATGEQDGSVVATFMVRRAASANEQKLIAHFDQVEFTFGLND